MNNLIKYFEYNIINPYEDPYLNEGMGVPNVLKNILEKIFYNFDISKPLILDINEYGFKLNNLTINYIHTENKTIYARAKSGKPLINETLFLNNPEIMIYLNHNKYDIIELKRVILHELLHIYEIYNRISNKTKKDLDWFNSNKLIEIRDNYKSDKFLNDFIYILYLTFSNEINARVAETYVILIEERSTDYNHIKNTLLTTNAWHKMLEIKKFNFDNYNINVPVCIDFFTAYNTLVKTRLKQDFKIFRIPKNEKDINTILKLYKILFDKKALHFENKLVKLINEVILDAKRLNSI